MDTNKIFEFLLELNQMAAIELISTYSNDTGKKSLLIFPSKSTNHYRISEQELRFQMVCEIASHQYTDIRYSVETPTDNKYSFNGQKPRSASTDLTIYFQDNVKLNIEFKSKNPSQGSILKDIKKLIEETNYGAWCHIFENQDRKTIETIFNKLVKEFILQRPIKPIYFSFLILKSRTLISRKGKDDDLINFDPFRIFDLKYTEYTGLSKGKYHVRDWQIDIF